MSDGDIVDVCFDSAKIIPGCRRIQVHEIPAKTDATQTCPWNLGVLKANSNLFRVPFSQLDVFKI
jgi:hypothetical protein